MAQQKTRSNRSKSSKSQTKIWWTGNYRKITIAFFVLAFATIGFFVHKFLFASTVYNIDTTSQSAVNSAYWSLWAPGLSMYPGWTGASSSCNAGNVSDSLRNAQIHAVNFARRMNHLDPVAGGNTTANANDQKAALIMAANGAVSHDPPTSWKCYTTAGHNSAATSNLTLNSIRPSVTQMIGEYLDEPGSSNYFVGHRRYLLQPQAEVFGFGITSTASAVQVLGLPTSSLNQNPVWTSWPTAGYFPTPLATTRWSLSSGYNAENFGSATVAVTHNGVSVPITRQPVVNGYGRPTIVWDMPSSYDRSGAYTVSVTNIKRSGTTTIYSHSYTVRFFTPVQ